MAELVTLRREMRSDFLEILGWDPALGPLLANQPFMRQGTLHTWVPEGMAPQIEPGGLHSAPFDHYPDDFGREVSSALYHRVSTFLSSTPGGIFISNTNFSVGPSASTKDFRSALDGSSWFSTDRATDGSWRVYMFVESEDWGREHFDQIRHVHYVITETMFLTSLPEGARIVPTAHYDLRSQMVTALIQRTEHVFGLAFDETSYVWWSKSDDHPSLSS